MNWIKKQKKGKKGKRKTHTYKPKPDPLYLALQLCQLLSGLCHVAEETYCSTAEDFAHVLVEAREYSSKDLCLARMGIGHLGQEAWAVESP